MTGSPKTQAGLMYSFEELLIAYHGKEGKQMTAEVGWPLLWAIQLATNAQLEAESQLRNLEDELKLEKDLFTALLASRLANKV